MRGFMRGRTATAAGYASGDEAAPILALTENGAIVTINGIDPIVITTTSNGLTTSASTPLAANAARRSLEFFNKDTSISIFIAFDGVTATTSFWEILPQSYYSPPTITVGAVSAIAASGTPILLINEGE